MYEEIKSYKKVCDILKINRRTLYNWKKQFITQCNIDPKKPTGGRKRLINNIEFMWYIEKNPSMTQKELAREFNVSKSTICLALKRINFTFKKKFYL